MQVEMQSSNSSKMSTSSLGRSLYRRILRELRSTRNYDHHLRDIRFLLWVPGTQGKQKFDALKRLAERSQSLHPRRVKKPAATASVAEAAVAADGPTASPSSPGAATSSNGASASSSFAAVVSATPEPKNPNPSIADQIRAVARELFDHHAKMHEKFMAAPVATSPPLPLLLQPPQPALITAEQVKHKAASAAKRAKLLQEGTARAFWAIKRMQDVRQGSVPTASMWLTGPQRAKFDPFNSARETHLRSGAFPFLPEFLGVDENLVVASPEEEEEAVIAAAVEELSTSSRCSSKALRLEVVARCASKEGSSARYHISFRVENTARDAAIDIKLAHLFAVNCESPPVLTEMVCSLPLLGNSILRPAPHSGDASPSAPFSFSVNEEIDADDDDEEEEEEEEEEDEEGEETTGASSGESVPVDDADNEEDVDDDQDDTERGESTEPAAEGKSSVLKKDADDTKSLTSSLLPTIAATTTVQRQQQHHRDMFTAKANLPDHCAVYDVTFPVQGECVLRGVVFYRVITNSAPPPSASSQAAAPTTVKSRLKALHFPAIRLTSRDDEDD